MSYSAIATPVLTLPPEMVEVVAPSTLEAGYTFEAVYNGIVFTAIVPRGGVKEGQQFTTPFTTSSTSIPLLRGHISPQGNWKDDIFDCCKFGIFHPSYLCAICCPQLLLAQVLTRMKMNWFARGDVPESEWRNTFKIWLAIIIIYFFSVLILAPDPSNIEAQNGITRWIILYKSLTLLFTWCSLIVLVKLRRAVRERYAIPEERCVGMEDLCCSFWCGCCTIAQLARHTANYEEKRALYCTDTGLPASHVVLVV